MKTKSFKLGERDLFLLDTFMKNNKIKNQSEAIRKCIEIAANESNFDDSIFDINSKLNKLIHNQFLTRKLLEKFFVNFCDKNYDVKKSECLKEVYERYNKYSDYFLK